MLKYLMINLKSSKNLKEILEYKKTITNKNFKEKEFVLFPSLPYLGFFYNVPYKIGSQNLSIYQTGSHTGEILASQLASINVSYCLVNHAESMDTEKDCLRKIKNATLENIKVVLCFGEEEKKASPKVVEELIWFLENIFMPLTKKEKENIILAYEPSWLIGKKENLELSCIIEIVSSIKKYLKETEKVDIPILYGGGITLENIENLLNLDSIDGLLIGNCANNPKNICKILEKI